MQRADLAQHAVDAVADAQEAAFGFEVDVGGVALDRVGEDRVDQAHHRLAVFVARRLQAAEVDLAGLDLVQDAVDRQLVTIGQVDRPADFGFAGEQGVDLERTVDQGAHLVEGDDVVGVGDGDREPQVCGVEVER